MNLLLSHFGLLILVENPETPQIAVNEGYFGDEG